MSPKLSLDRLAAKLAAFHAGQVSRRFFRATRQATGTQERLLAEILATGAASEFGRRHRLDRMRNYADFAAGVPIHQYADLAPYIDRVRQGGVGALFHPGERVLMFAMTSGTTAEPKYIPITPRVLADCRRGWNIWGLKALLDHPHCIVRHIVQVTSPMQDHLTPSGVPAGAITGLLAATQKRLVRRYYTSPLAIAGIKDSTAKYYTIMRLAIPKDVAWLVTANPATLLLLAKTIEQRSELIIRDIRDGTLTGNLPIEDGIRSSLRPLLRPDPACARRLEQLVHEHGTLRPKDFWQLGFLAHWLGGTMGLYVPQLKAYYGEVPSRDIGLLASEGRMSIPVADGTPAGLLAVTSQFFEFIPAAEYGTNKPTVLRSHEVRPGEDYFLLLTNLGGLYRYDIGDRVRVVAMDCATPVIEFLSRDAHTSSMSGEKLTENQVVAAMQQVGGATAVDFVLAPCWAETPYYRLYLEDQNRSGGMEQDGNHLLNRQTLPADFDAALCAVSLEYASKRQTLRLAEVQVTWLPPGTLAERDRALRQQRSRTSEQFKHQYLLPLPNKDADLAAAQAIDEPR